MVKLLHQCGEKRCNIIKNNRRLVVAGYSYQQGIQALGGLEVVSRVEKLCHFRKLKVGTQKLIIIFRKDLYCSNKFAKHTILLLTTDTDMFRGYNLPPEFFQLRHSLKHIVFEKFFCFTSYDFKAFIQSTHMLSNLESVIIRGNVCGVIRISHACFDDNEAVVETNPNLKKINIHPGIRPTQKEFTSMEEFVKANPNIIEMKVMDYSHYQEFYNNDLINEIIQNTVDILAVNAASPSAKTPILWSALFGKMISKKHNIFDSNEPGSARTAGVGVVANVLFRALRDNLDLYMPYLLPQKEEEGNRE